jgi:hypothetical protein
VSAFDNIWESGSEPAPKFRDRDRASMTPGKAGDAIWRSWRVPIQ